MNINFRLASESNISGSSFPLYGNENTHCYNKNGCHSSGHAANILAFKLNTTQLGDSGGLGFIINFFFSAFGNLSGLNSNVEASAQTNCLQESPPRVIDPFSKHATNNLSAVASGQASQEQIQEAIVAYQLYQKDEQLENTFKSNLATAKADGKSGQEAIKAALIETEKSGNLNRWESDWVYSLSHRAAQLGGDKTPTALAIEYAERNLAGIVTGHIVPEGRPVAG
jgi:hypothetical protein